MIIEEIILIGLGEPKRLKEYIAQDIDLVKYIKEKYYFLFGLVIKLASNRPELIEESKYLTKEQILELLKRKRPDLYELLMTEEGTVWFNRQDFSQLFTLI